MARATLFEEHASVLPLWWAQGVRDATLVCVDAHLDLQFISPERIARLKACANREEMQRLESPHPLSPLRDGCFGIEDFLYAASQLGVLGRLVWVAPPHVLADMNAALAALRQMEGVTQQDLDSFDVVQGGWIEGQLLGLRMAVVDLRQLPALRLDAPVIVDIDADYFVQVPQERIWMQPRELVATLRQVVGADADVTIARSVGTGFMPLRHRFVADHLAALWEGREDDAAHWQQLLDLDTSSLPPRQRVPQLRALLAQRRYCAATTHALAHALGPTEEARGLLVQAAALDPSYGPDLLRHLGVMHARRQGLDLATVTRLHKRLETLDDRPERLGAAWVGVGLLHAAFHRLPDAIACDERSLRYGGGHPDLALQIGRMEMAEGGIPAAIPWFERAAADDETRVAAWLHLSVCASREGRRVEARRWARSAHEAAPAWPEARDWLHSLVRVPD